MFLGSIDLKSVDKEVSYYWYRLDSVSRGEQVCIR